MLQKSDDFDTLHPPPKVQRKPWNRILDRPSSPTNHNGTETMPTEQHDAPFQRILEALADPKKRIREPLSEKKQSSSLPISTFST